MNATGKTLRVTSTLQRALKTCMFNPSCWSRKHFLRMLVPSFARWFLWSSGERHQGERSERRGVIPWRWKWEEGTPRLLAFDHHNPLNRISNRFRERHSHIDIDHNISSINNRQPYEIEEYKTEDDQTDNDTEDQNNDNKKQTQIVKPHPLMVKTNDIQIMQQIKEPPKSSLKHPSVETIGSPQQVEKLQKEDPKPISPNLKNDSTECHENFFGD